MQMLDPRWQQVLARDVSADGQFFYSVKTTGVYCRPSCGARQPNPENVEFHATAAAAEHAGFRPCKRCRPDQLDLPLDIQGAVFQQRVWQALREIPYGTTLSYSELASRIGQPKAVRAVASACAANTLAVVIPCHRVVRNDGSLSGYRWGLARKQALIEKEARE